MATINAHGAGCECEDCGGQRDVTPETLTDAEAEAYLRSVVHDPTAKSIAVDEVVRDVDYAIRIRHLIPESMWLPARQRICDAINAGRR